MMGVEVNAFFKKSNSFSHLSSNLKVTSFFNKFDNERAILLKSLRSVYKNLHDQEKNESHEYNMGKVVWNLAGSTEIPFSEIMCPKIILCSTIK